nr:BMP family ABC transporter substrate-binding protein [Bacillus sp. AP8]
MNAVGLLVPDTINDQGWGTKGYKALIDIGNQFDVNVFYREKINSKEQVESAIKEFQRQGVNFIIGNDNHYVQIFNEISNKYPDIHFVSVNGKAENRNTTSVNFDGYAMGYFGGMVASKMSKTGNLGVIAAYKWQGEIQGFIDGAKFQNPETNVMVKYVDDWDDDEKALQYLDELILKNVDVFYPAGDGYNVPVIEKVKEKGLFIIGYVSDQRDLGENTVLTSTVQHIDTLYSIVAEEFNNGTLKNGTFYFDFRDDVITMGRYSPLVSKAYQEKIKRYIENYKISGTFPKKE